MNDLPNSYDNWRLDNNESEEIVNKHNFKAIDLANTIQDFIENMHDNFSFNFCDSIYEDNREGLDLVDNIMFAIHNQHGDINELELNDDSIELLNDTLDQINGSVKCASNYNSTMSDYL